MSGTVDWRRQTAVSKVASVYGITELWDNHTKAWYADDTGLTLSTNQVTQWDDITTNNNDLLPYAADGSAGQEANRPTWSESTGVLFDGSAQVLKVTIAGWTTFGSVYAVVKQVGWASNDSLFAYAGTGAIRVAQKVSTPNIYLAHASGDSGAGTTLAVGDWGIIRLRVYAVETDNCIMVINEGSDLTNTTDMAGFTSAGVILGATHAAAPALQRYGNVAFKEIIWRDQVDDSTTEDAIYDYLANKYTAIL